MWLLERVKGADGALNLFSVFHLRGHLHVAEMLDALRALPTRHEALRTTFTGRGPELTQVVRSPLPQPPDVVRLVPTTEAELASAVDAEIRTRFALDREWPVRMRLFRTGPEDHVLVLTVHHIAADGVSIGVLMADLRALYDLHLGLRADPVPEPDWQQADYTLWQQRRAADGTLDASVRYWRESLAGMRPTALPPSFVPAPEPAGDPGVVRYEFPEKATIQLREAARRERGTLFASLLAAFGGHLGETLGVSEVVVPVMFANRAHRHSYRTVGFLANMLLLPLDLRGRPDFPELVRRSRRVMLDAMAHQEIPYHLVPPPGEEGRSTPQMLLEYLDTPSDALRLAGLEVVDREDLGRASTRFAVEFHFGQRAGVLTAGCGYSTDRANESAVRDFLRGMAEFGAR